MKRLKWFLLGGLGLLGLLVAWGLVEPHVLNLEEEIAIIPDLPKSWEGQKIGQLSDFQIGMWADNPGTARRGVKKLVEIQPAAVLISGDFIYHAGPDPAAEIEEAVGIVRPLVEAGIPTYAVLGNHDYGMSSKTVEPGIKLASRLETELEAAGIVVLENESIEMRLPNSNDTLFLAAVDSLWANQADVDAALKGIPTNSPTVALMHNPDTFEFFPANSAPLAVAGHTHGGQMRIPGLPQWSWLRFVQKDKVYADGWAKGYGKPGNNLYVNTGIGMSNIPIRIFCPPEVTIFTLQSS